MSTTKPVKVIDPEKTVPIEVLAEAITSISQSMKKVMSGPLTEKALVLLVTHAAPAIGPGYNRKFITAQQVKAVLNGITALEKEFVKSK